MRPFYGVPVASAAGPLTGELHWAAFSIGIALLMTWALVKITTERIEMERREQADDCAHMLHEARMELLSEMKEIHRKHAATWAETVKRCRAAKIDLSDLGDEVAGGRPRPEVTRARRR